jgi:hypothetical protein
LKSRLAPKPQKSPLGQGRAVYAPNPSAQARGARHAPNSAGVEREIMTTSAQGRAAMTARPQVSRLGTTPITVHHPGEVAASFKALAGEQGRAVEDMVAEAFNLLFAKYRKPEIAPVKERQVS